MYTLLMLVGIALLFLGLPTSIVVTIVFAVKKRKVLVPAICISVSIFVGFVFLCIGGYLYGQTDEYKQSAIEREQSELAQLKEEAKNQENYIKELENETEKLKEQEEYIKELESKLESAETSEKGEVLPAETLTPTPTHTPTHTPTPTPTLEMAEESEEKASELSEEEYKELCEELYYDDMFFGENDLEGEYIKLHLFLTEKYYFTVEDTYSEIYKMYNDKYNMRRDFFKASVLREGEKSYVGVGKVNLWFSEDIEIDPNSYKTGDHIIVYAEVISWSNNTMNGYNSVTIMPKYIEEEN